MRQAARTARYDQALGLEAYSLRAVDRPFPSHFHDHYVIGVVERGTRTLTCGRQQQVIGPGDVLLFNPGDSHACIQADGSLDYRGLNIPRSTMLALAEETVAAGQCPAFPWPWFGTENWQAASGPCTGGAGGEPEPGGRRRCCWPGASCCRVTPEWWKRFLPAGWRWSGPVRSSGATMPGISRWRSSAFRRD
ncbi:MAG: AraC family ligand binding domain-containing protein [Dysosmobacter welbionis]